MAERDHDAVKRQRRRRRKVSRACVLSYVMTLVVLFRSEFRDANALIPHMPLASDGTSSAASATEQLLICNRTIFLPEGRGSEREELPRLHRNGTLLLNGDVLGRLGNVMRQLFHGLDMARDRKLSFAVTRTSPIGRQFVSDLHGLFPFLSEDQMESLFGFHFTDVGSRSYQNVSTFDVYYYGGGNAGDPIRGNLSIAQLVAIKSERHRVFLEVFRRMGSAMTSNDAKTNKLCRSIESTGIGSDPFTVIHSRSFKAEGRKQAQLDEVNNRIGVHPSGLIEHPPDLIFDILKPLDMEEEKVFMISDGLSSSSANRLSTSKQFARTFQVVSDGDPYSDILLAVLSDVFIGNPLSTYSTLIAQIRYTLGLNLIFLHVRKTGDGAWETFCEEENCFYELHSV